MEDVAKIKPNTATLDAHRDRPLATLPAPLGVLLVDRRQRREVALDRARELLGVRRDDLQLLLAARAVALTARILAEAARDPRPLGTRHERHGQDEQDDGEDTHEPKDSRERATPSSPPRLAHSKRAAATRASSALAAVALTGCGGGGSGTSTTTATATTATTTDRGDRPTRSRFRTFFFRDGALVPVTVLVPPTKAVARAALEQLLAGPPRRLRHGDPGGRRARGRRDRRTASRRRASRRELGTPTRDGAGPDRQHARRSSRRCSAVRIEVDGKPVPLQNGAGDDADAARDARRLRRPHARTRSSSSARRRATRPCRARSRSRARPPSSRRRSSVEIWQGGKLVGTKTITASAGAPERGTWSTALDAAEGRRDARLLRAVGRGRLAPARDGGPLHVQ